jgi:hypothetical protein
MHKGDRTSSQGDNHLGSQNTSGSSSLEQHRHLDKWMTAAHQYAQETQLSPDQPSSFTNREEAKAKAKGIDLQKSQKEAKRVTVFMQRGQNLFPVSSIVQSRMLELQRTYPQASSDAAHNFVKSQLNDNEKIAYEREQNTLAELQQREVASQSQGASSSRSLDQPLQQLQIQASAQQQETIPVMMSNWETRYPAYKQMLDVANVLQPIHSNENFQERCRRAFTTLDPNTQRQLHQESEYVRQEHLQTQELIRQQDQQQRADIPPISPPSPTVEDILKQIEATDHHQRKYGDPGEKL